MGGKVYLVGCGVRAGHMTSDGMRALKASDVILYDRLVDPDIVGTFGGQKVYVGKKPGQAHKQGRINKLLYDYARRGKIVARLKGGDAFLFSRGYEEYDYLLERGVEVEVVPGISVHQVLGELGIPLTCRGKSSSVSFITASRATGSTKYKGLCADTLVFYMPVGNLEAIVRQVRKHKKKARCMLVENAGKTYFRVIDGSLDNIVGLAKEANVTPPALFVVSPVKRRLYAKKVLTFRQKDREKETVSKLRGFNVVNFPLYGVKYRTLGKPSGRVYAFTSPNAVESVLAQHKLMGTFVAIGGRTAKALKKYGILARVPKDQSSTGLMKYLAKYDKMDVVVFCSPHTRLRGYRRIYAYDISYKKRAPGLRGAVKEAQVLYITSSGILNTLCALVPAKLLNTKTIVVIGPKTAATAAEHGLHVDFMLEWPLIEKLADLR